jgi:hypothetical protein
MSIDRMMLLPRPASIRAIRIARWGITTSLLVAACEGSDRPAEQRAEATRTPVVPDSIRRELIALGEQDGDPRRELTAEKMQDTAVLRRLASGDSARTARLREIVAVYGWPDSARVGAEAAGAAFLILQHSPVHGFQKEMLPVVEELARRGALPRQHAALLIDRVLVHDSLPQRYGTQFSLRNGRLVMDPVEDEAGLEQRRAGMGLPTMDEYIKVMEEAYRAPAVRRP